MKWKRAGEEEVIPASWVSAWAVSKSAGAGLPNPASHGHLRGSHWDAYLEVKEILVPESRGES